MTENELNRAVARATGETVSEIRTRGFSLVEDTPDADESPLSDQRPTTEASDVRRNHRFRELRPTASIA